MNKAMGLHVPPDWAEGTQPSGVTLHPAVFPPCMYVCVYVWYTMYCVTHVGGTPRLSEHDRRRRAAASASHT